jgi:sulfur-carrier protein
MQVNIIIFGQLTDITGSGTITMNNVIDTDQLVRQLHSRYPVLAEFPYLIAVEKEVISSNTALGDNYTVALLPPYAGG